MSLPDWINRENIETAGIAISLVVAIVGSVAANHIAHKAQTDSRGMKDAADLANEIAAKARIDSARSATASEASTGIAQAALQLAEHQWEQILAAGLYVVSASQNYGYELREKLSPEDYDFNQDGARVKIINRGGTDALNLGSLFQLVYSSGDVKNATQYPDSRLRLESGEETVLGFLAPVSSMKSLAGLRLIVTYRDYSEHSCIFDFAVASDRPKGLILKNAILDGSPHSAQRLTSDELDLEEISRLYPFESESQR